MTGATVSRVTSSLLAAAIGLTSADGAAAQVKPRAPEPTERLSAPAKITAAQQPDGRIRVAWSPVEGAISYKLTRSVPPAGVTTLSVPNPSDTQYVDADVKAGSTYYYYVLGLDEAGFAGFKASTPPVTAASPAAAPPTSTTAVPPELTTVTANPTHSYPEVFIYWGPYRPNGVWYVVERALVSSGGQSAWEAIPGFNTRCCNAVDSRVATLPVGTRLIYRVTAVDSAAPANKSAPVVSNEVTTFKIDVRPSVTVAVSSPIAQSDSAPTLGLGVGTIYGNLRLTNPRWISLNESVATVNSQGAVTGRALGIAHIVVMGMNADGAVASLVYHVRVVPRP